MKTLVLASLLAASASAATSVSTNAADAAASAAASATSTPPPYRFLLRFPDGSLEVCGSTGFSIGFPDSNVDVTDCQPDKLFFDRFGG